MVSPCFVKPCIPIYSLLSSDITKTLSGFFFQHCCGSPLGAFFLSFAVTSLTPCLSLLPTFPFFGYLHIHHRPPVSDSVYIKWDCWHFGKLPWGGSCPAVSISCWKIQRKARAERHVPCGRTFIGCKWARKYPVMNDTSDGTQQQQQHDTLIFTGLMLIGWSFGPALQTVAGVLWLMR